MIAEAAKDIANEPEIDVRSRELTDTECHEVYDFIVGLPDRDWSSEDRKNALIHLLDSRYVILSLPTCMRNQAIYFKVKWG